MRIVNPSIIEQSFLRRWNLYLRLLWLFVWLLKLLFIYWCPRCRQHYCRELAEPQSCGCGAMEAEHLATIDPRLFLPELLNRKTLLTAIPHGSEWRTKLVKLISF